MTGKHFDESYGASAPENYQRFFVPAVARPLAEDLVRQAAPRQGERILDVGCGTGVAARLAAERVGREGRVVGLDINPGMIAVAKSVTPVEHAVEWREASAEDIPYDDGSFDVVLCQLSLQFMPDRSKALREMHRVLAPSGRLVINVPGPADPIFETLSAAMEHHIAPEAANFVKAVFALHDESEIEGLLDGAGFRDVSARSYIRELSLPTARDFLWQYVTSTPLAGVVAAKSAASRSAMEDEVLAGWAEHEHGDGLMYSQRIVVATALR